jgi:hypothetical protein
MNNPGLKSGVSKITRYFHNFQYPPRLRRVPLIKGDLLSLRFQTLINNGEIKGGGIFALFRYKS